MKKISKKLSLDRETLATLSPALLDAINGGQAVASGITPRTTTITTTVPRTSIPVSITVCPSRVICPPSQQCSVAGGGNGGKGQE